MKSLIFLLLTTVYAAFGATNLSNVTVKRGSEFPTTNSIAPTDLVMMSIQPGTASEKAVGVQAQNVFRPVMNGFVFIGDSLWQSAFYSFDARFPNVSAPEILMQQPNYLWHNGNSFNTAVSGSYAMDWNGVQAYYTNWVRGQAHFTPTNTWYGFCMLGINDIAGGRTEAQITNDLAGVWAKMRNDGLSVVASTVTTSAFFNAGQLVTWANVNSDIRSMSNLYTALIDTALLITNSGAQLLDGVHWSDETMTNWARFVNTNFVPTYSSFWSNTAAPQYFTRGRFSDSLEVNGGLFINGDTNTYGLAFKPEGPMIELGCNEKFSTYLGAFDYSVVRSHGNAGTLATSWIPRVFGAQAFSFNLGHSAIPGQIFATNMWQLVDSNNVIRASIDSNYVFHAEGANISTNLAIGGYITNTAGPGIYMGTTSGPTFGAGNGSLYLSSISNGVLYFKTNGNWVIK